MAVCDGRLPSSWVMVDEKSQIQALERTQPSLPLKRGCRAGWRSRDWAVPPRPAARSSPASPAGPAVSGSAPSVRKPETAIEAFIDMHNENPKPFVWTADLTDILPKIGECAILS